VPDDEPEGDSDGQPVENRGKEGDGEMASESEDEDALGDGDGGDVEDEYSSDEEPEF